MDSEVVIIEKKKSIMEWIITYMRLIIGLFLYSLGIVCSMHASLGFAPWDLFHQGFANVFHITVGQINIIASFIIVIINIFFLKSKVGVGTLLNMVLIGIFVDVIKYMNIVPYGVGFTKYLLMFAGMCIIPLGMIFYIGAGLGAGPRDGLFIGLSKKFNKSTKFTKTVVEAGVFLVGALLKAPFGIGTVIYAFCSGPVMQAVFKVFKFKVSEIKHQYIDDVIGDYINNRKIKTKE